MSLATPFYDKAINHSGLKTLFGKLLSDGVAGVSEYGYSLREIVGILDPQGAGGRQSTPVVAEKAARKARSLKI